VCIGWRFGSGTLGAGRGHSGRLCTRIGSIAAGRLFPDTAAAAAIRSASMRS